MEGTDGGLQIAVDGQSLGEGDIYTYIYIYVCVCVCVHIHTTAGEIPRSAVSWCSTRR